MNTNIPPPRFNNCLYFAMFALYLKRCLLFICLFVLMIHSFLKDPFPYLQRTNKFNGGDKPYEYKEQKTIWFSTEEVSKWAETSECFRNLEELVLRVVKAPRRWDSSLEEWLGFWKLGVPEWMTQGENESKCPWRVRRAVRLEVSCEVQTWPCRPLGVTLHP